MASISTPYAPTASVQFSGKARKLATAGGVALAMFATACGHGGEKVVSGVASSSASTAGPSAEQVAKSLRTFINPLRENVAPSSRATQSIPVDVFCTHDSTTGQARITLSREDALTASPAQLFIKGADACEAQSVFPQFNVKLVDTARQDRSPSQLDIFAAFDKEGRLEKGHLGTGRNADGTLRTINVSSYNAGNVAPDVTIGNTKVTALYVTDTNLPENYVGFENSKDKIKYSVTDLKKLKPDWYEPSFQ